MEDRKTRFDLRELLPAPLLSALMAERGHGAVILRALWTRLARLARAARASRPADLFPRRETCLKALFAVLAVALLLDTPIAAAMRHVSLAIVNFFSDVTILGEGLLTILPTLLVALWLARASLKAALRRERARLVRASERALFAATAFALPSLLTTVLKHVVGRTRPRYFETLGAFDFEPFSLAASKASFPSGHATTMAALIIVVGAVGPRWRRPALVLAGTIFLSRIVVEAHFVSDVLAGALIGFSGAAAVLALFAQARIGFGRDRKGTLRRLGVARARSAVVTPASASEAAAQAPGAAVLSWPRDRLTDQPGDAPRLSIVVPMRNEADNARPLIEEIEGACAALAPFEIICVDDGSGDATAERLLEFAKARPHLRVFRHAESCGQSAAVRTGVRAARAAVVATLDGDGQNDPTFIPSLVKALASGGPATGLVAGQRRGRKDTGFKKLQSLVANEVRAAILQDGTRDTGCGLKAFRREAFLALPYFDGLHRFLPALMRREGYLVGLVDVVDRPRRSGRSNYGLFDRLWVGILDLAGVWWLIRRRRRVPLASDGSVAADARKDA